MTDSTPSSATNENALPKWFTIIAVLALVRLANKAKVNSWLS